VPEYLDSIENPDEIGKEYTLPDIDAERNFFNLAPSLMTQLDEGRQKSRRQIIDAEIPNIF